MSAQEPTFTVALLSGACAGTSVDITLFPMDTLKTRLQVNLFFVSSRFQLSTNRTRSSNILRAQQSPMGFAKAGGFKGVYNGLFAAAVGSATGAALFFGT